MRQYVDPPEKIKEIGRVLLSPPDHHGWRNLRAQLNPGEELFGMYDVMIHKVTVLLNSQAEFEHFEKQYLAGEFVTRTFYAAPASVVD